MATEALEAIDDETSVNLGGRPTLYRYEYCEQAFRLALLGATDIELADAFDVHEDTIYSWKRAHPEFAESVKMGKAQADADVAHRLFNRTKQGDTTAMIFWLKNRKADLWRDRANVDVTSNGQTISSLAAAAWAYGEQLRAQQISSIEGADAQKLLSEPREP